MCGGWWVVPWFRYTSVVRGLQVHPVWRFEELKIQVDGGSENWNKISFVLAVILLERYSKLQLVRFSRMRVGHTKNDVDQKFSVPKIKIQGRKALGEDGQTVLGHSEWVRELEKAFAQQEAVCNERAAKRVRRRRSRVVHGKTRDQLEAERKAYEEVKEPMQYHPQCHNWDVISIVKPLIDPVFAGYGPIRDKALKAAGHTSCHVIEFYRADGEIHWHYKGHMVEKEWVDGGPVYDTILTRQHDEGDYADMSACEVICGLGDGTIVPNLEYPAWFDGTGECDCAEGECTCESEYSKFKHDLHGKLDAAKLTVDAAYIEEARADWTAHFDKWDDHETFLADGLPVWQFPAVADESAAEAKQAAEIASANENAMQLARCRQVCAGTGRHVCIDKSHLAAILVACCLWL